MQLYFFDISWDGETLADDEGTSHFDDGSAVYYGARVAGRLARSRTNETVRVHVRDDHGRLLSVIDPARRSMTSHQWRLREIVERDLARQKAMANAA